MVQRVRKTSTEHGGLVLAIADIESGKVALPPSIPPNIVRTIIDNQKDLYEVANEKKGFHEVGVIKMKAHLFIVVVQRELGRLDVVCNFDSVDENLIQELEKLSSSEINDRMLQLRFAQKAPPSAKELDAKALDFCYQLSPPYDFRSVLQIKTVLSPKNLMPHSRPSSARYLGVRALDVHYNHPEWTYAQVAKHLGYGSRIDGLMNNTERFLERLGIEVRRPPAAGKTRPEKRRGK